MGSLTTRFALTMPDPADQVDISQLNVDLQAIDNGLGYLPCTSSTRPSTPSAGQVIYETDTRRRYLWDTSGAVGVWVLIGTMGAVVASNKVVTNSATLDPVTEWSLPLAASTSYEVEALVVYSAATGADAQLGVAVPSGATMLLTASNLSSAASAAGDALVSQVSTTGPLTFGGVGVGVNVVARVRGTVTTGVSSGQLALSWAQAVAAVSNATLVAGSLLVARRV